MINLSNIYKILQKRELREVLSSEESYKYWRDLSFFEEENFKILPERDENLNSSVTKKDVVGSKIVALYTLVNGGHIYASPNVKYSCT